MKKYLLPVSVIIASLFTVGMTVHANPSYFSPTAQTATATTTPTYMTPGTATSTLVFDSFGNGSTYSVNSTELFVQFSGSSTTSQLNTTLEYANSYSGTDCSLIPTSCDWYQDTFSNVTAYSTSTTGISLNTIPSYTWTLASSTVNGVLTSGPTKKAVAVKIPTRYVRAVFTCGIGGTNCAVWAQFNPSKERPE